MRLLFLLSILISCNSISAQISLDKLDSPYDQDFNSLPQLTDGNTYSWVNNTTLSGWYIYNKNTTNFTFESTPNTTNNNGGIYVINDKGDFSLGSKASNATNHLYYGVRFKNNTGFTISAFEIKYQGEQWNISENGTNTNKLQMHYQIDNNVLTDLNNGAWQYISNMDFVQLYTSNQSSSLGGSACSGNSYICLALDGNHSNNRRVISNFVPLELEPEEEIFFRWQDLDDNNNDHHLQIDDIKITPTNKPIILPIDLIKFEAITKGNKIVFEWETRSERNNDYFEIEELEESSDRYNTIGRVSGRGNSSTKQVYAFESNSLSNNTYYFRLKQTDYNGSSTYTAPITVEINSEELSITKILDQGHQTQIEFNQNLTSCIFLITDLNGKAIANGELENSGTILFSKVNQGIHLLKVIDQSGKSTHFKVFIP